MADVLLTLSALSKSYGNTRLFQDLSLSLHRGLRLGLIGPNGSGKSTLMKILADRETCDSGEIAKTKDIQISYLNQLDQHPGDHSIQTILEAHLSPHLPEWEATMRITKLCESLGIEDTTVEYATLSGGWKKRVSIAAALLEESDLLLLDEPTNHLDLTAILWLENQLKQAKFSYILVSHDRQFLENRRLLSKVPYAHPCTLVHRHVGNSFIVEFD